MTRTTIKPPKSPNPEPISIHSHHKHNTTNSTLRSQLLRVTRTQLSLAVIIPYNIGIAKHLAIHHPPPSELLPAVLSSRPLPLMSGNSDDPPAPDSERADRIVRDILESNQTRHTISPSGELYRLIERYHDRHDLPPLHPPYPRPNLDVPRTSRPSFPFLPPLGSPQTMTEQEPQDADFWRRLSRENGRLSPFAVPPQPQASAAIDLTPRERALNARTSRRGRIRSMFHHPGRSGAAGDAPSAASSLVDLQNAGRQLEQASSTLRAHLDAPLPSLQYAPRSSTVPFDHLEAQEDSSGRRAKRRKIETDEIEKFHGFRYGKYGQVEAGKLKMEIVSCDGGIYQEGPYSADNVLRSDDTVYCTKSNRCNLVLRHQGATVFSLTELLIKAPHSGYTAPVQEGMVFVSMTSDDLLTRTARYQIQYSPPRSRTATGERPGELPPIVSIRHNRDGSAQARAGRLYEIGVQDEECDTRTAQIPPDFTSIALPFQVTTECSDSEEEDFARPYHSRRPDGRYAFETYSHDSSEDDPTPPQENYLMNEIRSHRNHHVPLSRRETASNITLAEAAEASQIATQEAIRAVGGELMVPHAKFFIERDKSKCTVRFDPPVSGRFILLKMWSPHHDPSENIDVQSVVAKGFAGPRFIPDVTYQ